MPKKIRKLILQTTQGKSNEEIINMLVEKQSLLIQVTNERDSAANVNQNNQKLNINDTETIREHIIQTTQGKSREEILNLLVEKQNLLNQVTNERDSIKRRIHGCLGFKKRKEHQKYNNPKIQKKIKNNKDLVSLCKGKTVYLLLGISTVGKSTLVNAVLHGPLKYNKKLGKFVRADGEGGETAKTGTAGFGESCTKYPTAYEISDTEVLLDTRGYFDTEKGNNDKAIASYFLMIRALKMAKEIKLIYMERYYNFSRGLVGMNQFGTVFGKIVKTDKYDLETLFVLNDFKAKDYDLEDYFKMNKEEKEKYRNKNINEGINKIWQAYCSEAKKLEKRTKKRLKANQREDIDNESTEEEIEEDPEFISAMESYKYVPMLITNYKKGFVIYFDPTDADSIQLFTMAIRKLKPVPFEDLVIDYYNEDAIEFKNEF